MRQPALGATYVVVISLNESQRELETMVKSNDGNDVSNRNINIELVSSPYNDSSSHTSDGDWSISSSTTDDQINNNNGEAPVRRQSQSSTIKEKNPPHSRLRRPSNTSDSIGRGIWSYPLESNNSTNHVAGDEIAWKIISIVKGWCIIWVLFAVIVISSELFSSTKNSTTTKQLQQQTKNIVTVEDEQLFLEISENIVSACSYSNLDTEAGREECQQHCHNHMCCFIDDDNSDAEFESHRYGCANDPEKMCAAYAGCESLVVAEDDAIIYDADGVDVFDSVGGDGDSTDVDNIHNSTQHEQSTLMKPESATTNADNSVTNYTNPISVELQLIQQVISSVCIKDNLHTRHGMMECVSLCAPSMCCFNRTEIEYVNPKMDLKLKMEGIGNDLLDRTAMGTCISEDEGEGDQNHFCHVHYGCQNILLLGASQDSIILERNRHHYTQATNPSSIEEGDPFTFTDVGVYKGSSNISSDQQRMLGTVCTLFGLMIGLTAYLLIHKRKPPVAALNPRTSGEEMVEFV